ncbi:YybH family protein [Aestuariivivens sediminis]|uniref:YybH family protein n=1 Tax=Aestuariivivens sediminis TaxID=2913557 RepID=UPI001F570EB3|nr:nuclear transport factor 2 family protein [Aestuariivivens sediminis]
MKKHIELIRFVAILLCCMAVMTGCKNQTEQSEEPAAEPAFDLATAKTEIIAANDVFEQRFMAKDSAGVANLYTTDGKFMMTGSPSIVGREAITSVMSGFINSGVNGLELTTIEVWGTEDLVTEEGEYTLSADDTPIDHGKYLVLWKRVDGQWLLCRDIFNSNMPQEQTE